MSAETSGVPLQRASTHVRQAIAALEEARVLPILDTMSVAEALRNELVARCARGRQSKRAAPRSWDAVTFVKKLHGQLASTPSYTGGAVVWAPREPTHIETALPVIRELVARDIQVRTVSYTTKLHRRLTALGLQPVFLPAVFRREMLCAQRSAQEIAQRFELSTWLEVMTDGGVPRGEAEAIAQTTKALLPLSFGSHAFARGIRRMTPSLVWVGNDLTLDGRILASVCGDQCPTVALQHGNVSLNPLNGDHIVRKLLVFGEAAKRSVIDAGYDGQRVATVGAPHLGPRQSLPGPRYVLVASSGPGHSKSEEAHQRFVDEIEQLAAQAPTTDFVVKLHRKDHLSFYESVRQKPNVRVIAPSDKLLGAWLGGAWALITGGSTAAKEAWVWGLPVVSLDPDGLYAQADFVVAGACLRAQNAAAAQRALSAIREGKPWAQRALQKSAELLKLEYNCFGAEAVDKACDVVEELLKVGVGAARQSEDDLPSAKIREKRLA